MKVVIPISSHDFHLLEPQVLLEEHLDGLRGFEVVLSPSVSVKSRLMASGLMERLQMITRNVSVLDTGYMEAGGWPSGPNRHWARTVIALDQQGNGEPFFWKELDCWSLVPNAMLRLNEEHMQGKKLFTGCIVNTPFADRHVDPNDQMMMGCSVYCPNLSTNWEFRPILDSLMNGVAVGVNPDLEDPWDIMARGSFRKWGWTATDLIGDRWNTKNYRISNGMLEHDEAESKFKNIVHKHTDISKAVVIHGCKDDSLAKLVMSGEYDAFMARAKAVAVSGTTSAARAPQSPKDALEALLGRTVNEQEHGAFLKNLEQMLRDRKPIEAPVIQALQKKEDPEPTENSSNTDSGTVLGKIEAILATQNMRWGKLAEAVGMSKEDLRGILDANGYSIASVSQWVKKKV